jgi:hypothetical protein
MRYYIEEAKETIKDYDRLQNKAKDVIRNIWGIEIEKFKIFELTEDVEQLEDIDLLHFLGIRTNSGTFEKTIPLSFLFTNATKADFDAWLKERGMKREALKREKADAEEYAYYLKLRDKWESKRQQEIQLDSPV